MTSKKNQPGWQQIRNEAVKLADILCESSEYIRFQQARDKLSESDNAEAFNELRQRQMALHLSGALTEADENEISEYDLKYMLLVQDPLVSEYLFAEGRFFRLIADLERIFSERLDIWQSDDDERPDYLEHDINLN